MNDCTLKSFKNTLVFRLKSVFPECNCRCDIYGTIKKDDSGRIGGIPRFFYRNFLDGLGTSPYLGFLVTTFEEVF